MADKTFRIGVIGCGGIANGKHLPALSNLDNVEIVYFCDIIRERAQKAKADYGTDAAIVTEDYHDVINDKTIDAVHVLTPNRMHSEISCAAMECGKHVLCEKSITLNSDELNEALQIAEEHHVILAEAMTIWHMPLYKKLWEIVSSGELGKVQMIQLNFGSYKEYDMNNRFFNINLAGGALLDIGVYALSLMRSFMAETPDQVMSQVRFAPTGTDEQASIILMNKEQQMAAITLSMHSKQPKRAMISCEKGYIEIMEYPRADKAIIVDAASGAVTPVEAGETKRALEYEMRDMEEAVQSGDVSRMQMPFTRDVMNIMTDLRKNWGLVYPEESGKTE